MTCSSCQNRRKIITNALKSDPKELVRIFIKKDFWFNSSLFLEGQELEMDKDSEAYLKSLKLIE